MIILTIRTDKPEAEIGLYENGKKLSYQKWQAHRELAETIHHKIATLSQKIGKDWGDIQGVVVFKGPGSFTGLRIGLSVGNAIAYSNEIPIVGTDGANWLKDGIDKLQAGEDEKTIIPSYGAEPHITKRRK